MRLFNRYPAAAIAVTALSPIPHWITRTFAAVSGYPTRRYVLADTLGRLPKLWVPAAVGTVIAAGRTAEAVGWLDAIGQRSPWELPFVAPARALAAEAVGRAPPPMPSR